MTSVFIEECIKHARQNLNAAIADQADEELAKDSTQAPLPGLDSG